MEGLGFRFRLRVRISGTSRPVHEHACALFMCGSWAMGTHEQVERDASSQAVANQGLGPPRLVGKKQV